MSDEIDEVREIGRKQSNLEIFNEKADPADAVSEVMAAFELAEFKWQSPEPLSSDQIRRNYLPPTNFHHVLPLGWGWSEKAVADPELILNPVTEPVRLSDLSTPLNVSTLSLVANDFGPPGPLLQISRWRSAKLADLRGVKLASRWPIWHELAFLNPFSLTYDSFRFLVFWCGERWIPYNYRNGTWLPFATLPEEHADYERVVNLVVSIAFTLRYEWRVDLANANGTGVSLTTDPFGARALFRLRELEDGEKRRGALRHWVSQHWRGTSEDVEALVREHLRGKVEFHWTNLSCTMHPSDYDVARAQRAEALRADLAKAGGATRLRRKAA